MFGVEFRNITLLQYCILLCVVFFIKQENKNTWSDANLLLQVYNVVFFISFIIVVYIQICEQYLKRHHQENETTKSLTITNVDQLRKQLKELMRRVLVFDTNITVALFVLLIFNGTTRKFYTSFLI